MITNAEQLALTSFHYRQLDFLRLFKFARNLGIIKRKRKMPTEYRGDDERGQTNARSACRRLLREVIKYAFPKYELNSSWSHYYVHIPEDIRTAFLYIRRNFGRLEVHENRTVRDMLAHYVELQEQIDGHVYPNFPYQINIHLSTTRRSRYRTAMRRARGRNESTRPPENFHECAVACVQYRDLWSRYISEIVDVVKILVEEDEAQKKLKRKKAKKKTEADIQSAIDRRREAREERLRNAQHTFDQALARYKERRGQR